MPSIHLQFLLLIWSKCSENSFRPNSSVSRHAAHLRKKSQFMSHGYNLADCQLSDSIQLANGQKLGNYQDGVFRSEQELSEIKPCSLVDQTFKQLSVGDGMKMRLWRKSALAEPIGSKLERRVTDIAYILNIPILAFLNLSSRQHGITLIQKLSSLDPLTTLRPFEGRFFLFHTVFNLKNLIIAQQGIAE